MKFFYSSILLSLVFLLSGCAAQSDSLEQLSDAQDTTQALQEAEAEKQEILEKVLEPPVSYVMVTEKEDIVGSWYILEGGDAEEIVLEEDGTYQTFLHSKPFETGIWMFEGGKMIMNSELGKKVFQNVVFEENLLILEGPDDLYEMWERVREDYNIE